MAGLDENLCTLSDLMARGWMQDCIIGVIGSIGTMILMRQIVSFVSMQIATNQEEHQAQQ